MLIRSGKSKKTQQEDNLNRDHSTEGKQRAKQGQALQAHVQGSLSDMVRQSSNGILEDEQVHGWLDDLREQSPAPQPASRNPKIFKTYVLRGGKLCQINGDSQS